MITAFLPIETLSLIIAPGSILASIIGYGASLIICLITLNRKCGVKYEETAKQFINILCGTVLMVLVLVLLKLVVPISSTTRLLNIPIIILYTLVGGCVYFIYMIKTGSLKTIFGEKFLKRFKKKATN